MKHTPFGELARTPQSQLWNHLHRCRAQCFVDVKTFEKVLSSDSTA